MVIKMVCVITSQSEGKSEMGQFRDDMYCTKALILPVQRYQYPYAFGGVVVSCMGSVKRACAAGYVVCRLRECLAVGTW